jgi:hypothetical protein
MPRRVLPCSMCDQCALQSLHHLENLMSLSVGFDEPVKLRNTFRRLRLMPPRHARPTSDAPGYAAMLGARCSTGQPARQHAAE